MGEDAPPEILHIAGEKQVNIAWEHLDHGKFLCVNPLIFFILRVLQHPFNVVKTRYQAQRRHSLYASSTTTALLTLRHEGIRGLYRGFGTSALQLGVQQFYILTYEYLRSARRYSTPVAESTRNAASAAVAVFLAQLVANPIDVVAQRLMLQGQLTSGTPMPPRSTSAHTTVAPLAEGAAAAASAGAPAPPPTRGAAGSTIRDVVRHIVAERGVRGLWAGFHVSCLQFIPSASMWWASYPIFRREAALRLAPLLAAAPSDPSAVDANGRRDWRSYIEVGRVAELLAGACASATVAVVMNPVDVVRVRTQVEGLTGGAVLRTLLLEEGAKGLFKGTAARVAMLVPQGAMSSSAYELVKRLSIKDEFRDRLL